MSLMVDDRGIRTTSRKVLVVDDSATMRKIVIRSLQAAGFTNTAEAPDGEDALTMFQQQSFDLVLTDWNMPKKSGIELIRAIRALGSTVPIFMITTEGERSRVVEAIQAGANDYLLKPFTVETLEKKFKAFGAK